MELSADMRRAMRDKLCDRIDRIAIALPRMTMASLGAEVDGVRRFAREFGFMPVADIARALESAIGHDEHVMALPYLDLMREAAGCECCGEDAGEAFLANVSVRMG
ncbi:hypothetical protein [Flavisphingomonas formosensis]|uniref:hypothetical protein n=1 Tax=Flavisphingomonas formosensis TaxID=861534 RepID=UPI0012F8D69C|nr:hypothetical protein [Sphingomonas formosensis]